MTRNVPAVGEDRLSSVLTLRFFDVNAPNEFFNGYSPYRKWSAARTSFTIWHLLKRAASC